MKVFEPRFTKIVDGLKGAEGPVFDTSGNFYVVAPMADAPAQKKEGEFLDNVAGKLCKVDIESKKSSDVCIPQFSGYGGRPAGCQVDKENAIWIADMRLGLLKWFDGKCIQISKVDSNGETLQSANDLVIDDDGNVWFTAPGGKIAPEPELRKVLFEEPVGCFYCLPRGQNEPIKVDDGFIFCNGIAVKDKLLLVAETVKRRIIAYDITGAGKTENKRVWAEVPKDKEEFGGPDGMDFDSKGQLLVASYGQGCIEVYGADGGNPPVARIKCPFNSVSNLHFKQGTKTCYVTEHDNDAVWSFEWENEGMPMYCDKQ